MLQSGRSVCVFVHSRWRSLGSLPGEDWWRLSRTLWGGKTLPWPRNWRNTPVCNHNLQIHTSNHLTHKLNEWLYYHGIFIVLPARYFCIETANKCATFMCMQWQIQRGSMELLFWRAAFENTMHTLHTLRSHWSYALQLHSSNNARVSTQ